jgi:hypothetical protein
MRDFLNGTNIFKFFLFLILSKLLFSAVTLYLKSTNDYFRYKFTLFNELYFLVAGGTLWIGADISLFILIVLESSILLCY